MNWNAHVLSLSDKGYTPEDIVTEINNPFITLKYVQNVLLVEKRKKTPKAQIRYKKFNKIIYDYYLSVGKEQFLKEVKVETYAKFAKRLGVKCTALRDFMDRFIKPRTKPKILEGKFASYERQLITQGKLKAKPKPTRIQDIQNLW
jgi:hypothetical protein